MKEHNGLTQLFKKSRSERGLQVTVIKGESPVVSKSVVRGSEENVATGGLLC
jgi:hypothetical protein